MTDLLSHEIVVDLDDVMCREALDAAVARQRNAEKLKRKPGNNLAVRREQQLALNLNGARGERACKVLLDPIVWHAFKPGDLDDTPDLGDFIDVKTLSRYFDEETRLLHAKKDGVKRRWAYVLVVPERIERRFRIVGWAWGFELQRITPVELQPGRPAHILPGTIPPLRPLSHLQKIAHMELPQVQEELRSGIGAPLLRQSLWITLDRLCAKQAWRRPQVRNAR
jgi:hypothetical protein